MTGWEWLWPVLFVALVVVAIVLPRRTERRVTALMQEQARGELEVIGHLRRTMVDLRDRDPLIAESVELGLAELDARTPLVEAMARGDFTAMLRASLAERRRDRNQ